MSFLPQPDDEDIGTLSIRVAKELWCGGFAGSIGITFGYPLDVIKTRMQMEHGLQRSPFQYLRQTVANEGVIGLYRGLPAPFLAQFFMNSLSFAGDSLMLRFLEPNLQKGEVGQPGHLLLSGCFGGLVQCSVLVPSDLVKCKMQTMTMPLEVSHSTTAVGSGTTTAKYLNTWDCALQIVKNEGFQGLYRGFGVTAMREVPSFGIYFFVYKNSLGFLRPIFNPPTQSKSSQPSSSSSSSSTSSSSSSSSWSSDQNTSSPPPSSSSSSTTTTSDEPESAIPILISGGLAGAASWLGVYPFDVMKTNVQLAPPSLKGKSLLGQMMFLYKQHGWRVFFKGLGVTLARAFPVNACTFYFYERMKATIGL